MLKSGSLGLLLAFAAALCGSSSALAQAAVDTPTAGTATVAAPTVPGVAINLNLVQQILNSAGQLEESALGAGSANLSANISRLNPSASASGGAGSGGSSSSASTGR
jgi:hypothetical protein